MIEIQTYDLHNSKKKVIQSDKVNHTLFAEKTTSGYMFWCLLQAQV